jgi:hypothetical protein
MTTMMEKSRLFLFPREKENLVVLPMYRLLHDFWTQVEKQKLESVENIPVFESVGHWSFVKCDEPHFTMATPRLRQYRV